MWERTTNRQLIRSTRPGGKGSNQYAKKPRRARKAGFNPLMYLVYLAEVWALVIALGFATRYFPTIDNPKRALAAEIISPLPERSKQATSSAALVSPTPTVDQRSEMARLIRQVFGEHADKAFRLLSCENSALNPDAVNTAGNYPPGSRDIGIFQINEYWQKTQARFLFDPEINIRAAYLIYRDSGYTFKMWSCGKRLGI